MCIYYRIQDAYLLEQLAAEYWRPAVNHMQCEGLTVYDKWLQQHDWQFFVQKCSFYGVFKFCLLSSG